MLKVLFLITFASSVRYMLSTVDDVGVNSGTGRSVNLYIHKMSSGKIITVLFTALYKEVGEIRKRTESETGFIIGT
jgi:hypothetical protein